MGVQRGKLLALLKGKRRFLVNLKERRMGMMNFNTKIPQEEVNILAKD